MVRRASARRGALGGREGLPSGVRHGTGRPATDRWSGDRNRVLRGGRPSHHLNAPSPGQGNSSNCSRRRRRRPTGASKRHARRRSRIGKKPPKRPNGYGSRPKAYWKGRKMRRGGPWRSWWPSDQSWAASCIGLRDYVLGLIRYPGWALDLVAACNRGHRRAIEPEDGQNDSEDVARLSSETREDIALKLRLNGLLDDDEPDAASHPIDPSSEPPLLDLIWDPLRRTPTE